MKPKKFDYYIGILKTPGTANHFQEPVLFWQNSLIRVGTCFYVWFSICALPPPTAACERAKKHNSLVPFSPVSKLNHDFPFASKF